MFRKINFSSSLKNFPYNFCIIITLGLFFGLYCNLSFYCDKIDKTALLASSPFLIDLTWMLVSYLKHVIIPFPIGFFWI